MNPTQSATPDEGVDVNAIPLPHTLPTSLPAGEVAGEKVNKSAILGIFKQGGDFNSCLREAFPMTPDEISKSKFGHLLSHVSEDNVHTSLAREKLKESGLFGVVRLEFITTEYNNCLARAQELLESGNWQSMLDATAFLLNSDGHGSGMEGFDKKCGDLFKLDDPATQEAESQSHQNYRTAFFEPLRDQLDGMFSPLHAVSGLAHVEDCISTGTARDSRPYTALKRFAENLAEAKKLHPKGVPETYFSDAIKSAGENLRQTPKNPNITFSQAEEKAKELARILIRSEHRQLQGKSSGAKKEELEAAVKKIFEGTGFTLENCGFTIKDKTSGVWSWKKVVGYELVEEKKK